MNIQIENYLSEDEIREIVEEEFRKKIKTMFNTEQEITRIINNLSYENTFKIIEEEVPNFRDLIKEKTKNVCENISSYCVFREKDTFTQKNSLAQDYLEEAVKENKEVLNDRVVRIFEELDKYSLTDEIHNILDEKICNLFKGEGENGD